MSLFARGFTRQNIVAIAVGAVLACVPLVVFNFWLSGVAERIGQEEIDLSARNAIVRAEHRLALVIETLDALAAGGVGTCDAEERSAMQRAVFATAPIKDISLLDRDGRSICPRADDAAADDAIRRIYSSESLATPQGYALDVLTAGNGRRMIRLRRPAAGGGHEIAALVPTTLLLPQYEVDLFDAHAARAFGGPGDRHGQGLYARLETRNRAMLAEVGQRREETIGDLFIGKSHSDRFGLRVEMIAPRSLMAHGQWGIWWLGLLVTGAVVMALGLFAAFLSFRQPHNPVADIERALAAGEFVPYYQPIVDIATGQLRGAEVLVRWKKPDGSLVLPGAFIPLAESSGLIRAMTYDLMRRVSDEVGPAIGQRLGLKVSFNFAGKLFADDAIVQDVFAIFAKSAIKMSQVVLEVTERDPIENFAVTRQIISSLQGLGVRIAIDDVGTGHSGLSYMLKLGVDIIKIDKMFIDSIGTDRNSTTIVETLVDLAHNMRMDVIAEGVENFEQVMHLREIGIRAAQGYVFAPPLPGSAFLKLVEAMDALGEGAAQERDAAAAA
ncbi:MAG: EAL domain-containing protein [Proteobacteria bacterium]|nr:EAL domain-containing protein [Pseudomonadota bacterium]